MTIRCSTPDAYNLFHQGSLVFAEIENNGIRIDVDYLDDAIEKIGQRITVLQGELQQDEVYKVWSNRYGAKTTLGSREQLAQVIFGDLKYPYEGDLTPTGRFKTDEDVLSRVNCPFLVKYLKLEKLKKDRTPYLTGIRREVVDGYLHPFFNLAGGGGEGGGGGAKSYRSSSSGPNFQNYPKRDPIRGKVTRRCFIPRHGNLFIEVDFKGAEVTTALAYHGDPVMKEYLLNPKKDMHWDVAVECFCLEGLELTKTEKKDLRYAGKNQFVFPQFYGSVYFQCAPNLWETASKASLGDIKVIEHLQKKGMRELGKCDPKGKPRKGTYEYHIKTIEEDFWGKRFKVYAEWKRKWYNEYLKKGGFSFLTGFYVEGEFAKNQVINMPIQGAAFHCLLWSLIQLQRWITKNKKQVKIVGQIHDSMLLDCPLEEVEEVVAVVREITTQRLSQEWTWLIVPLQVEIEIGEQNWFDQVPYDEWLEQRKVA